MNVFDGLGKFLVVRFKQTLPKGHLSLIEPGSQDRHMGACLGVCASKWSFSNICDSFYTRPTRGKNPVQLRVHFPRFLITAWLCARLQASIKDRDD